jgi:hypothetical protein
MLRSVCFPQFAANRLAGARQHPFKRHTRQREIAEREIHNPEAI